MKKISEILFSFFNPGVHQTIPAKSITLPEVVENIKSDMYKKETLLIRAGKALKTKILYSVTFAVLVSRRCGAGILEWTGFMVFDIDKLDFASTMKWRLSIDVFLKIVVAFISPGGKGVKFVVRVLNGNPDLYADYFQAVALYVKETLGVDIDQSGKDKGRLCFLCWDPAVFYNPDGGVESDALLNLLPNEMVHAKGAMENAKDAEEERASVKDCPYDSTGVPKFSEPTTTGDRPSDKLNRLPQVHDRAVAALKADGWQQNDNSDLWTRPGKTVKEGCSAIYNYFDREGIYFFTNFSTNAPHFGRRGYTDVQIINILEFFGNWQKCISDLSAQYLN